MRCCLIAFYEVLLLACAAPVFGQDFPADQSMRAGGDLLAKQRWQVGAVVEAVGGPARGVTVIVPVPSQWPEQQVITVAEDISPRVHSIRYRNVSLGTRLMVVEIPRLDAGETANVLITFEVQKHAIVEPANPQTMKAPRNPPPEVRPYLLPSPYIESQDPRIRALAKQIANGPEAPWQHVEAIFDWVRENIEYQEGSLKGAVTALRDGNGDCEELTSLFIALCRASNIPARTVWVPGHCYPEFYLQDEQGRGQWLPCQVAGQRDFGRIFETRPILQKGDNFRIPEDPRPQRYVQIVKSLPGRGFVHPQVKVIQQPLSGHGRNRSEAGANRN